MESIQVEIPKPISGRRAIELVRLASMWIKNPTYFLKDDREVNIHSLLGLLSLGLKEGDLVEIRSLQKEELETVKKIIQWLE